MPASTQQSLNYTFGQAGFFGYTGIGKEHMMWWASLPAQAPLSREELRDTTTLKEDMLRQFEGYHAPVEDLIWNTEKSLKVNMEDIASLATWHRGKVLLLGDAAHVVNSSSGQGASLALEDALYLARLIRDSENTYHSVFEQFERERKPRVERIIMEGRRKTARKKPVKGVRVKIGEWMMGLFVGLFGEKSLDKNYRYTVDF
jgi:2-polyprenyl-6-methoxyphenol hydroxylase-like FAD-dependent oxidoreductase